MKFGVSTSEVRKADYGGGCMLTASSPNPGKWMVWSIVRAWVSSRAESTSFGRSTIVVKIESVKADEVKFGSR